MDCSKNYILCRIENLAEHKFQFLHLTEAEHTLEIYAENSFESPGPKGTKLIAKGKRSIPKSKAKDVFGVPYDKIDSTEKKLIWNAFVSILILDYHDKEPDDILFDDLGFDEPETSDITDLRMNNFDNPSYFRRFEKSIDGYRLSVTFSSVCYQGVFYGVKAVIYDIYEKSESGIFLCCQHPIVWTDPSKKTKKRGNAWSMKKYKDTNQLLHILDCFGFNMLYKLLVIKEVTKKEDK